MINDSHSVARRDSPQAAKSYKAWPIIGALALLFLIRFGSGLLYSRAVPAWESYDEPWHFAYAIQIETTGTLPQDSDPIPNNERIQPPAYYFILALFLKITGSDVSAFQYPDRNPYFYYGISGLNYALHPQTLSPGERQVENALEAARWFSLLLSLPGIAFTYRAARLIWPKSPYFALAAAAIFALWPQGLFNGSVISNDGPAMTWGALLTWGILYLATGHFRLRQSLRVGLLCVVGVGLGLLIKINLLVFVLPLVLIVFASASVRLMAIIGALGALVLVATLEILQHLPQILLPFGSTSSIIGSIQHLRDPNSRNFILDSLNYALHSTFGLFGWGNVNIPDWLQGIWIAAAVVAVLGAAWLVVTGRFAWRKNRRKVPAVRQWLVIGSILVGLIGGALALVLDYQDIHLLPGRYLLPGLAAFSLLLVAGWSGLPGRTFRRILVGSSLVGLVVLSVTLPIFLIAPVYYHPPFVADSDVPHPMNAALAPGIALIGYDVPTAVVYPGGAVPIDLYFKASFPLLTDYTVQIVAVGPDGQGHGILDSFPGNGNYPTSMWTVNQAFRDHYEVPIQNDFPAPALAHFLISLLPADAKYPALTLGTQAIHARNEPAAPLDPSQSAIFGPGLLLRGVTLQLADPVPDPSTLNIDLIWEAISPLPDRTVFIHLQNNETRAILTQRDQPPNAGLFPLSWWLSGEVVGDHYSLPLPLGLPPGKYPLRVGLYNPADGERWTGTLPGSIPAGVDGITIAYLEVDAQGHYSLDQLYPASTSANINMR